MQDIDVFESLLPGIREIRTPLAVGYGWLVVCWLAFGELLRKLVPTEPIDNLRSIVELVGPLPTGAAASVAAYLVGVVTTSTTLRVTTIIGRLLRRTWLARLTPEARRADRIRPIIEEVVLERLSKRAADDKAFEAAVLRRADKSPDLGEEHRARGAPDCGCDLRRARPMGHHHCHRMPSSGGNCSHRW